MNGTLEHSLKDADMAVPQHLDSNMFYAILVPTQPTWSAVGPYQFLGGKKPTKSCFIIMAHFCREIHKAKCIINNLHTALGLY